MVLYNNINNSDAVQQWNNLPNVVLIEIFTLLSDSDLLNTSSTCINWRRIFYHPKLWSKQRLQLKLIDRTYNLSAYRYKMQNFLLYSQLVELRFDPTQILILKEILQAFEILACNRQLKSLILRPITSSSCLNEKEQPTGPLCDKIFHLLKDVIECSPNLEELSFGCWIEALHSINDLMTILNQSRHQTLKSLHLASIKNSETHFTPDIYISSEVFSPFRALQTLSIDSTYLTENLLHCFGQSQRTPLNKLIVHVSEFRSDIVQINDSVWQTVSTNLPNLRVTVHMINAYETFRKYARILRPEMPLSHLRMYFCSSLNVDMLCYLSIHYRNTLECLDVMDSITEPALRYHNPFRTEPDPLVLLAWQCKQLTELSILGYEVLEVNLLAIAKLRPQLRTLNVCVDCVMTLQFGRLQNRHFFEDDDGEDAFVDYGHIDNYIQTIISESVGWQWRPLQKHELPIGVYEFCSPLELSCLEQIHNSFSSS
ncbi:unnamed protein product [Didymodactylos carnosus]|uniref:F-box domain-containing protein n=1 Tax=Didymodactylos carnosus TaxID=1234261 RepID=A0A814DGX6_9BILA|nr:unnamed protein product [Didymodactylos carnosus]CAF1485838.1 unnamed protein product [Didymodactylos carnosus]CAF3729557.1 unnamed protein product [Didymodactylos carnosus]CAF4275852.1 unnamed protein product [Didymodactylos carnosus]